MLGADTHKRSHSVAAVAAATGELLGEQTIQVGRRGFDALLRCARGMDDRRVWALEACRHVSGGLERFLIGRGERVLRIPTHLTATARRSSVSAASPITRAAGRHRVIVRFATRGMTTSPASLGDASNPRRPRSPPEPDSTPGGVARRIPPRGVVPVNEERSRPRPIRTRPAPHPVRPSGCETVLGRYVGCSVCERDDGMLVTLDRGVGGLATPPVVPVRRRVDAGAARTPSFLTYDRSPRARATSSEPSGPSFGCGARCRRRVITAGSRAAMKIVGPRSTNLSPGRHVVTSVPNGFGTGGSNRGRNTS